MAESDNIGETYLANRRQAPLDRIRQLRERERAGAGQVQMVPAPSEEAAPLTEGQQGMVSRVDELRQEEQARQEEAARAELQGERIEPGTIAGAAASLGLQVVGGVRDAAVETMQTINMMGDWLRDKGIGPQGTIQVTIPEVPRTTTPGGDLTRSASQFISAMAAAYFSLPSLGAIGATTLGAKVGVAALRTELAGVVADVAAFDGREGRLSDSLAKLDAPLLDPMFEYLKSDLQDTQAEGKFKNAIEGLLVGQTLNGFFRTAKLIRASMRLRDAATEAGGELAEATVKGVEDVATVAAIPADTVAARSGDSFIDLPFEKMENPAGYVRPPGKLADIADSELSATDLVRKHGGINVETSDIATEFRDIIGRKEGGPAVAGLMNNRNGKSVQEMAEIFEQSGHAMSANTAELKDILERSVSQGQDVISSHSDSYLRAMYEIDPVLVATWKNFKSLSDNWEQLRSEARREDVRPTPGSREAAREEAAAIRAGEPLQFPESRPLTDASIRAMNPGVAMNDAQAVALVDTVVETSRKTMQAAQEAMENDSPQAFQRFLAWFEMQGQMDLRRIGVRTEAGRTLSILNDPTKSYNTYLDQFSKAMGKGRGMTPRQLLKIVTSVKSIEELQQIAQRTMTLVEDGKLIGGRRGWNAIQNIWTSSILSSPHTLAVNSLSNGITQAVAVPERLLAAAYGDVPIGEAAQLLNGMLRGIPDGMKNAWTALRRGEGVSIKDDFGKFERYQSIDSEVDAGTNPFIKGMEWVSNAMEGLTRPLMASDELFYSTAKRGEMQALAYRQAVGEGLRGKDVTARIGELLTDTASPITKAGDDFALYSLFRTPLDAEGVAFRNLGLTSQHMQRGLNLHPVGRFVLPFVRTPTNILRYTLERTPLGLMSQDVRNMLKAGGPQASMAMARMQMGGAMLSLAGVMTTAGLITGRGPSDPRLRRQWEATHQPYSVKIGDTWVSYQRLDPFGMIFGLGADFSQIAGELMEENGPEADKLAAAAIAALWGNLASKTYVRGLAELMNAFNSDNIAFTARAFSNLPINIISGFIPSLGTAIAKGVDPVRRTTVGLGFWDTLYRKAAAKVPGFSDSLPPFRNVWGEQVLAEGGWAYRLMSPIWTREANENPLDDELLRLEFPLSLPPRGIQAGKLLPGHRAPVGGRSTVRLTPEQFDKYIELQSGVGLKSSSGANMPPLRDAGQRLIDAAGYKAADDGVKRELWHQLLHDSRTGYRTLAKDQLLREDPKLQIDVLRKGAERSGLEPGVETQVLERLDERERAIPDLSISR